jgi:hypothetical protein
MAGPNNYADGCGVRRARAHRLRLSLASLLIAAFLTGFAFQPTWAQSLTILRDRAAKLATDIRDAEADRRSAWQALSTSRRNWSAAVAATTNCPASAIRQLVARLPATDGRLESQFSDAQRAMAQLEPRRQSFDRVAAAAAQAQQARDLSRETPARRNQVNQGQGFLNDTRQMTIRIRNLQGAFTQAIGTAADYRNRCIHEATFTELGAGMAGRVIKGVIRWWNG